MKAVGIKNLKNKLSEYVKIANRGETVLVTDRDRVVAELVPPRSDRIHIRDAWIEEEIRKGNITPARSPSGTPLPPRPKPVGPLREIVRALRKDRNSR